MSTPRKHHYLPQCYLEGFKVSPQTGDNAHIWQIEKGGDLKHYCPAIEDTGCIRNFHTIDVADEEPDHQSVEALLSKLESEQAALIRAIGETKRIEKAQLASLSAFISLMRYRVPSFANHIEKSLCAVVLDTFKIMNRTGKFGATPPALQKLFDEKGIDASLKIKISNWKVLSHMFGTGLAPESIGLLMEYKYHLYSAEKDNFFVTSDNPVALYHPNYEQIRPYGVGFAIKGVEVTFPLSSDTLIRASHSLEPGSSIATADEVREFNRRTITASERYIFAGAVSEDLLGQIGGLKDTRAGFVFDNLFHGNGSIHISRYIPVQ